MRTTSRRQGGGVHRQRGIALVLVTVSLSALVLAAALALDVGRVTRNKATLQTAVDAAALAGAKALDQSKSTTIATATAYSFFNTNATSSGNQDVAQAWNTGLGPLQVTITYSSTLPPFVAGSPVGPYVRVVASTLTRPTWFARLFGMKTTAIGARAVAGPSATLATVCNSAPVTVCTASGGTAANHWGLTIDAPVVLKQASGTGSSIAGPGNFQLLRLGGNGASIVRDNLAGAEATCLATGELVQTQTGNLAGPTAQGIETRFGVGSTTAYPPDVIVKTPTPSLTVVTSNGAQTIKSGSTTITAANINTIYSYTSYLADLAAARYDYPPPPNGIGRFDRRTIVVPLSNCAGLNGSANVSINGFACFFLLDKPKQQGSDDYLLGQFISNCDARGTPGNGGGAGSGSFGPYRIQLYRDPGSGDS